MDKRKNLCLTVIFSLLVICLFSIDMKAEIRDWTTYSSFGNTKDAVIYNDDLWFATTGGLVRINPRDMSFETYSNIDGLQTNQLFCLYVDDINRFWVGGHGRLVNFTDPEYPDGYLFTDNDGILLDIEDIDGVAGGDSLWLASRAGLILFLPGENLAEGLVLDTYSRFGDIDRDTPVRKVALDDTNIWVGTDAGLAVGSRFDIRQLKAPTGWTSYLPSDLSGPSTDSIKALTINTGGIFVGTPAGVYQFNPSIPEFINLNLYGNPLVYNMSAIGDSLMINSSRGSTIYFNGVISGLPTAGPPIPNSSCGMIDMNGDYWHGGLVNGIYFQQGNELTHFSVGSLPSNDCRQIISAQGKKWGAFWNAGLAYLDNDIWTKVDSVVGGIYCLGVGPFEDVWAGTWGNGVFRIMGDSITHFTYNNSALSGIAEAPQFTVVADIHFSGDAIWFANLRAAEGELVAVNPYDLGQWQNYILTGGVQAEWVETLTSGQGTVYIGSANNGVFARLYNGSPFYAADDYTWQFTSANSGIGSDIIRYLKVDEYDSLWVGTSFGLSYQSLGEIIFTNEILPVDFGPEITAIGFDGQGTLYSGSRQGMAIRDIATGNYEHLTEKNSGLVSNVINDIFYDSKDKALWISTVAGISRMTIPARLAADEVDNVLAYPNPYIIRTGDETVRFNYSGLSRIKIFSLAGELIREIAVTGIWDGLNSNGQPVASGVYLFTITARDGEVGRGKIFLIRE
ncbi:MAG: T9SS type A sorting domain-containing protein [Candidatus Zixiibacteriota bacterium]